MVRKVIKVALWVFLALLCAFAVMVAVNWTTVQRTMLGGLKVYETVPPPVPEDLPRPAVLVFSKTNGFRHEDAIPAANAMLAKLAKARGWGFFQTENGAAFDPLILSHFDAVVFNNVSGDVFTPAQRAALRAYIENSGSFVGLHAAGDNSHAAWAWYVDTLIGTHFIGHPMFPQFQQARVIVTDTGHPATQGAPGDWRRRDEWYSFDGPPRGSAFHVLARLDERSFANHRMFGRDIAMGADHPIVWWRCVGKGRVFYSAMGHLPEAYKEPAYTAMLTGALDWAARREAPGCPETPASP